MNREYSFGSPNYYPYPNNKLSTLITNPEKDNVNNTFNKRWSERLDYQEEILFDANHQDFATPIRRNSKTALKVTTIDLLKPNNFINIELVSEVFNCSGSFKKCACYKICQK